MMLLARGTLEALADLFGGAFLVFFKLRIDGHGCESLHGCFIGAPCEGTPGTPTAAFCAQAQSATTGEPGDP